MDLQAELEKVKSALRSAEEERDRARGDLDEMMVERDEALQDLDEAIGVLLEEGKVRSAYKRRIEKLEERGEEARKKVRTLQQRIRRSNEHTHSAQAASSAHTSGAAAPAGSLESPSPPTSKGITLSVIRNSISRILDEHNIVGEDKSDLMSSVTKMLHEMVRCPDTHNLHSRVSSPIFQGRGSTVLPQLFMLREVMDLKGLSENAMADVLHCLSIKVAAASPPPLYASLFICILITCVTGVEWHDDWAGEESLRRCAEGAV